MAQREKKGYARKVELGLVPSQYDKSSRKFLAGAHKHWTGDQRRDGPVARNDAYFLQHARRQRRDH